MAARAQAKPGWWFLAGLALGLLVALWVYLKGPRAAPDVSRAERAAAQEQGADKKTAESATTTKPRFTFYTILQELEVALPDQETGAKPQSSAAGKPDAYILQAGSFKSFEEADRLKASLNLIGVEAGIQTVTVNNKDTWHRVQIGPYRDLAELNAVRARLKQNNIDAVLLKLKS